MARGGRRYYRDLSPEERERTFDVFSDLLDAACEARRTGWRSTERDPIYATARSLRVWIWPALMDELVKEARRTTAAPLASGPRR